MIFLKKIRKSPRVGGKEPHNAPSNGPAANNIRRIFSNTTRSTHTFFDTVISLISQRPGMEHRTLEIAFLRMS